MVTSHRDLLEKTILGATKEEVTDFLGEPDRKGRILVGAKPNWSAVPARQGIILPANFMYDCGNTGPNNDGLSWTFIICFDEHGKAYEMVLDD